MRQQFLLSQVLAGKLDPFKLTRSQRARLRKRGLIIPPKPGAGAPGKPKSPAHCKAIANGMLRHYAAHGSWKNPK